MNTIALVLLIFVVLGLTKDRLGRFTYVAMGLIVLVYVSYAYYAGG